MGALAASTALQVASAIESAQIDGQLINISAVEVHTTGPDCVVVAMTTYPMALGLIPRTDNPVRFTLRQTAADCNPLGRSLAGWSSNDGRRVP